MELLIGLVALGLIGIALFGIGGFAFIGAMGKRDRELKSAAPSTFDATFNGDQHVTYRVNGIAGPDYGQVVSGAVERGYRLAHDSGKDRYGSQTLIFERSV